jgi:tRNA threonylcarbamoyladenosine biosynthesis protein TsaE
MLIRNEAEMRGFGARLVAACESGGVITLSGNLGAGKTTLVRGALESLGVSTGVRSPTYTLIEYYELSPLSIAHLDLYRLADGEELEYLGYRDYLNSTTICLIEWPERAGDYLSSIGLEVSIEYDPKGRRIGLVANSDWGNTIIAALNLE